MTLLLSPAALVDRAPLAAGPHAPLAALAQSLRHDLDPLVRAEAPWIPPEKARMTRLGGRCPAHGALLDFDPWQPRAHRCPTCGTIYTEEEHYRWWLMNYQLWLAERAVHAALLAHVLDDAACDALAQAILRGYAAAYERWPNRDNVLGPTRPFFSTYLESIWMLQLAVSLDLLESRRGRESLGDEVRARLLRPSATLIASYEEGFSNRQVYHNAALAAAGVLLDDEGLVMQALHGSAGLVTHTTQALLADGTWYEGENYHLFAHRGLWYGVTIAETLGVPLPPESLRRFGEGFATPFATALPDFTFPSRRDSQYRVSLRQWRIAESCELGLARGDDPRLVAALAELYDAATPAGDSGRARSTAEAERNAPPVRLDRSALGWKGLLLARAALPAPGESRPRSVHLTGQGVAVFRRGGGRTYAALDYGESGGGHGHPDRLNLWLVVGSSRVLEDVGTGSYVDPTLHWYRSTLAHNAPLADGRSQWRVAGQLIAFHEGEDSGLVAARATIAPGVEVERTLVVLDDYLVDEVRWRADRVVTFDLPWHFDATPDPAAPWRPAPLAGGRGLEDGFDFLSATDYRPGAPGASFVADVEGAHVRAWFDCDVPHEWWRCVAPGPPGEARRPFLLLRARARAGCIRSLLSWTPRVTRTRWSLDAIEVSRTPDADGASGENAVDAHRRASARWYVVRQRGGRARLAEHHLASSDEEPAAPSPPPSRSESTAGVAGVANEPSARPDIVLSTLTALPPEPGALADATDLGHHDHDGAVRFVLARGHYRRSEEPWEDAGAPRAHVALAATRDAFVIDVAVHKAHPVFSEPQATNPLDNEHPDINSDGVQLYLGAPAGSGRYHAWLLVPEGRARGVRVTARASFGAALSLEATSRLTAQGWALRIHVPRAALGAAGGEHFTLDLIVNDISPDRERRRGQLVLSGGHDEWIYLRGDRQDPARALHVRLADA